MPEHTDPERTGAEDTDTGDATPRSRVVVVAVDAHDPERLAEFWCAALGVSVVKRLSDAHGTPYVEIGGGAGAGLLFQHVTDEKVGKNRLHLDVAPVTGDHAQEVERLTGLGATVLDEAPDHPWVVLADPEGNEFCVLAARSE